MLGWKFTKKYKIKLTIEQGQIDILALEPFSISHFQNDWISTNTLYLTQHYASKLYVGVDYFPIFSRENTQFLKWHQTFIFAFLNIFLGFYSERVEV